MLCTNAIYHGLNHEPLIYSSYTLSAVLTFINFIRKTIVSPLIFANTRTHTVQANQNAWKNSFQHNSKIAN